MGLTNSVIFKILFIMLKKEDSRFKEKSIFKEEMKHLFESRPTKKVKTELTDKRDLNFKGNFKTNSLSNLKKQRIPGEHKALHLSQGNPHKARHLHQHEKPENLFQKHLGQNPPLQQTTPSFLPRVVDPKNPSYNRPTQNNIPYLPRYNVPPNPQVPLNNIQRNLLHELDSRAKQQTSANFPLTNQPNLRGNLPIFQMPNMMASQQFPNPQMNPIYPRFGNLNFPVKKTSNYPGVYPRGDMASSKPVRKFEDHKGKTSKMMEGSSLLKKRTNSESRKERKSSLSDDTDSISSSSISYSLDTKEEPKKKSNFGFMKEGQCSVVY